MPKTTRPRIVRLSDRTASRAWCKLWAYSYADLAQLFKMPETCIRQAVSRGALDPGNLQSICRFWIEGRPPGIAIVEYEIQNGKKIPM